MKKVLFFLLLFVHPVMYSQDVTALSFQYFEPYIKDFKTLALPYEIKSTLIKPNLENVLFEECNRIIELENKTYGLIGKMVYSDETDYLILELEGSKEELQVYNLKLFVYVNRKNAILKYAVPHLTFNTASLDENWKTNFTYFLLDFKKENQQVQLLSSATDTVVFYRKMEH